MQLPASIIINNHYNGYQSRLNVFNELGFETLEGLAELDKEKDAAKGRPKPPKGSTSLII